MSTSTVPGPTPYDIPLPMIWPDDTARTRSTDPLTSHAAADASTGSVQRSHDLVIRILEEAGSPLTQEAIVARAKSWPYASHLTEQRIRTAVSEVAGKGSKAPAWFVRHPAIVNLGDIDDGVVGRTSHDNKAQLWTLAGDAA